MATKTTNWERIARDLYAALEDLNCGNNPMAESHHAEKLLNKYREVIDDRI